MYYMFLCVFKYGGDGGFLLNETADGAKASLTEVEIVYVSLFNHTESPISVSVMSPLLSETLATSNFYSYSQMKRLVPPP